jgi:hypothetical protein
MTAERLGAYAEGIEQATAVMSASK